MSLLLSILLALATAAFLAAVVLLVRGIGYRPTRPLRLQVLKRQDAPGDLFVLHLGRAGWARCLPLPRFAAGQSLRLRIPGQTTQRRYSLARWRRLPWTYELAIKREPHGRFSSGLHGHAQPGAELLAERPDGHFTLKRRPDGTRAVLIAGGVGITPLLAMLDAWSARLRLGYTEVHLYWQMRHADEAIYRDTLDALVRRNPGLRVRILISRPTQGAGVRIDADLLRQELGTLHDKDYYLCASNQLLDAMLAGLGAAGVGAERLHYERFSLGALTPTEQAWTIHCQGRSFSSEGHASLLAAMEAATLPLDADCRTGSCGRCLVAVSAGSATHLIQPEFTVPVGHVLACCARPTSDVQLQIPATRA